MVRNHERFNLLKKCSHQKEKKMNYKNKVGQMNLHALASKTEQLPFNPDPATEAKDDPDLRDRLIRQASACLVSL